GAEALVRWKPDGETPLPPSVFIPIAEETGIIHDLGQLVLEQICRQIAEWKALGFTIPPIAVNISPLQLNEYNFPNKFLNTLQGFGLPARQIIIEITETAFLHDRQHSTTVLQQLQNSGIAIHLDDFGTGYSSFSYLSDLPLDAVKIDKSFINRCISSEHDDREAAVGRKVNHTTILEGIITLARGLHLKCIAEGVETPEQAALLQSLQCNMAQGFYYFRPMPPRQMQTLW
ncbi:MAG: EAL domain-containing protein, partial [Spirochaeta sp.]